MEVTPLNACTGPNCPTVIPAMEERKKTPRHQSFAAVMCQFLLGLNLHLGPVAASQAPSVEYLQHRSNRELPRQVISGNRV
eukprot:2893699-Amphidinium_carterae.1